MDVYVLSLEDAINYNPNPKRKTAILRIQEPHRNPSCLRYEDGFCAIHEVAFHDISYVPKTEPLPSNCVLFSKKHALEILAFFEANRHVDAMVIHCVAGVSRSAAVAIGLAWFLSDNLLEKTIDEGKGFLPNALVLEMFSEVLGNKEKKGSLLTKYLPDITDEEFEW